MSAVRLLAGAALLLVGALSLSADPSREQIARWVADLASGDPAVSRPAMEKLWRAGKLAEPALRAALKHPDPDVILRARVVLARFEWGVFPDTPPAIVQAIEKFREGDRKQQTAAVEALFKEGKAGYRTLRHLIAREHDPTWQQQILTLMRSKYRPLLRDRILARDHAAAAELLEIMASTQDERAVRDLAAFCLLTGRTEAKLRELEPKAAGGDRVAALWAAYLHRANGDLAAARRMAEKANRPELLAGILAEQEDYAALARDPPEAIRGNPTRLAILLYLAGNRAGHEAALGKIPGSSSSHRSTVLYFTGRPWQALEEERRSENTAAACEVMTLQGRRHDVLALVPEVETKNAEQRLWVRVRQAAALHEMGETEEGYRRLLAVLKSVEKTPLTYNSLVGEIIEMAGRMGRRDEIFAELGRIIDALKATLSPNILRKISPADEDALVLWWNHLRSTSPDTPPSATLSRLRGWFERGKADRDFEKTLEAAARKPGRPGTEQERWDAALARAYLATGKPAKAEEVLVAAAKSTPNRTTCMRLGDFYFERKRWKEAATEYRRASDADPSGAVLHYLHGTALEREQKGKGRPLVEVARLLVAGDEAERYNLYRELDKRGLVPEADAERMMLVRTAPFGSIYTTNALSGLAYRARRDRPLDAARHYRHIYVSLSLGSGGAFMDSTAYLWVPAQSHLYQARGLLAAGKLDAAVAEARRYLVYLPEEGEVVIDLVRALGEAGRKAEADRLFDEVFARQQRACSGAPKAAKFHNRLAWLAARCGRELSVALRHARLASALKPDAPGYLDTLAEVHFQRGEKAEAAATMRRAVKLAPEVPYYAAQLKRIEAGDPTADLPQP